MTYLVSVCVPLLLLGGLFMLTEYETRRGVRLFASRRARLDESVTRVTFVLTHVDFGAFLHELTARAAHRAAHDVVHLSLRVVRAVERALTHLFRSLRARGTMVDIAAAPREDAREFVKTLSSLKSHLEANRPEIPEL